MNRKNLKTIKTFLWIILTNTILIICELMVPFFNFIATKLIMFQISLHLLLGLTLVVLTFKTRVEGKAKFFLLLAGFSSLAILVFAVLHNLFYALAIVFRKYFILRSLLDILHGTFFIISVLISPFVSIFSTIKSIHSLSKK